VERQKKRNNNDVPERLGAIFLVLGMPTKAVLKTGKEDDWKTAAQKAINTARCVSRPKARAQRSGAI
jgi:hypothetical protein